MTRAGFVIAIGSNVDPETHYPNGLRALHEIFEEIARSPIYLAPAVGAPGTPEFWNGAMQVRTNVSWAAMRTQLRAIEEAAGRVRTGDRNAPRTLDLDLVLALGEDGAILAEPAPEADLERFHHVLWPVSDLLPDAIHPGLGVALSDLRRKLPAPPPGFRIRRDSA